jgi:hypothetical protein
VIILRGVVSIDYPMDGGRWGSRIVVMDATPLTQRKHHHNWSFTHLPWIDLFGGILVFLSTKFHASIKRIGEQIVRLSRYQSMVPFNRGKDVSFREICGNFVSKSKQRRCEIINVILCSRNALVCVERCHVPSLEKRRKAIYSQSDSMVQRGETDARN